MTSRAGDARHPVSLVLDSAQVRREGRAVLHDVSLTVAPGEIVALLGPNGAGKSTLLAALGGHLPVSRGSISRPGRVATVLQSPALARRTAAANVELALAWWRVPRRERRDRALEALARMGAEHLARRPAQALSGGEQRRVHLARALAVSPDLLLLDEPFDGLDPASHAALRDDLAAALRTTSSTVVVVLHDRADAWAMADRLVVLVGGRVHADGAPQQILDQPPTVETAELLGFDGRIPTSSGVVLTRPRHVQITPDGEYAATAERVVPVEDGWRVRLQVENGGTVWTRVRTSAARTDGAREVTAGDRVRFDVVGGARFPTP